VLIADFDNQTGDPAFDGSLEQAFQIGLEIAPFITSYSRSDAQAIASEIGPQGGQENHLEADVARLVSVRENIGLVMSGTILPDGKGYELTVVAIEPQGGEIIAEADVDATDKSGVLAAVGRLAGELTEELGGDVLDEDIAFAADSFTAASLEAVKNYTIAQDLQAQRLDEEAAGYYAQAVELDPNFTRAYSGWALSAFTLGQSEKSEELWSEALANLDRVTERERLRTLGLYYSLVTRNFSKALESYKALVEKYPADEIGQNNLAVQQFYALNFDEALAAGKRVKDLYPGSAMYQANYSLFAMYAGDFETGETEARGVLEKSPDYDLVWLPIAMKAVVDGDFEAARNAYESMEASSARGAPGAQVGLGDLASYTGDFEAARKHLGRAVELATADDNQYVAATAHMAIAFAHEAEGDLDAALEASARAIGIESGEPWIVQAALLHIAAGDFDAAATIAAELTNQLQPQTRAYGMLIEGLIAHGNGRIVDAIEKLSAALELADFWLIRFYLGRVYLDAGYFAEAVDELSQCIERRGEAASLFLDDIPTYRYVAPVYYWLGRAESQLGMGKSAKEKLQQFIELRPTGGAYVEDARKRL
jgi:tetratricopeptide (TPR) repeat protein